MALTTAFLNTCRSAIASLAELTAFRESLALTDAATRAERIAAWHATFSPDGDGICPAHSLRQAIRGVVHAQADLSGALGTLDRESAYRTLAAEFVPVYPRPATDDEANAAFEQLLLEDRLS